MLFQTTDQSWAARLGLPIACLALAGCSGPASSPTVTKAGQSAGPQATPASYVAFTPPAPNVDARSTAVFDRYLAAEPQLSYAELAAKFPEPPYRSELSFDPREIEFYAETVERLKLTEAEQQMLRQQGFVSVDHQQRYSFGSAYFSIYSCDLPVLITTDSVLHALHRSYDDMLMDTEHLLAPMMANVLSRCHKELASIATVDNDFLDSLRDIDLYLTVARNLLEGAGGPKAERTVRHVDGWDGKLIVPSHYGQNEQALEILRFVQELKMQHTGESPLTKLNGSERAIDYSQFRPRGHYTKSAILSRYFRTMMWLGRADTAWTVLPPPGRADLSDYATRGVKSAQVLTRLMHQTGGLARLEEIDSLLALLVGRSDNLGPLELMELMERHQFAGQGDFATVDGIAQLQAVIAKNGLAAQQIRSEEVRSNPEDLYQPPPPGIFQVFGQRYVVDSFLLTKVVFDAIIHKDRKVKRYMPAGADVMFSLGNNAALPLLEEEIEEFPYAANLNAARAFVDREPSEVWDENIYTRWLATLRTLDCDLTSEKHAPQTMQTAAWQRKQLQTQLASWSELRHNTVLYAKQSFTGSASCEYPFGYVEPYPETYASVRELAGEWAKRLEGLDVANQKAGFRELLDLQVKHLARMAEICGRLETLARKELAAEPFTDEEQDWLKSTIDAQRISGGPHYTGWYCDLFYKHNVAKWEPTVIDVHTDPNAGEVLEVGVGNCNFLVAAIDSGGDRRVYVGPVYSYYEFRQDADERLTDEQWATMLENKRQPARPAWTGLFQPAGKERIATPPPKPKTKVELYLEEQLKRYRQLTPEEREALAQKVREHQLHQQSPPPPAATEPPKLIAPGSNP